MLGISPNSAECTLRVFRQLFAENKKLLFGHRIIKLICVFQRDDEYPYFDLSRIVPDTSTDDIIKYAKSELKLTIACEKLKTKYTNYTSFNFEATCCDPSV